MKEEMGDLEERLKDEMGDLEESLKEEMGDWAPPYYWVVTSF